MKLFTYCAREHWDAFSTDEWFSFLSSYSLNMTDLISDGEEEDDEEEDKIEGELGVWYCVTSCEILISKLFSLESDEVSEEIAEGELDDASEDIVEEVDDSTVTTEKNELNRDEQVITDAIDDDGERPWFCTTFQCPLHLWHNMLHTHFIFCRRRGERVRRRRRLRRRQANLILESLAARSQEILFAIFPAIRTFTPELIPLLTSLSAPALSAQPKQSCKA